MHALEMHLLFVDLGKVGTELRVDLESSCSSLGRIVRIPCRVVLCCVVERWAWSGRAADQWSAMEV